MKIISLHLNVPTLAFFICHALTAHAQSYDEEQYYGNISDQDILAISQIIEKTEGEYIDTIKSPKLEIACIDKIYPEHPTYEKFLLTGDYYQHPRIKKANITSKFALAVAAYTSSKATTKEEAKGFFDSCLKAITTSLDSESDFFTKTDFGYLQKLPKDLGIIGIELITDDIPEKNTVIRTFKKGPAYAAGVRAGDKIISIDGINIQNLKGQESIGLLRGKVDSLVSLEINRVSTESSYIRFDIPRKTITSQIAESKLLAPDYGYIQIYSFGSSVSKEFAKELLSLYSENKNDLRGLILDLRFCTGGLLNQASGLVAPFLPENTLVTEIKGRTKEANFKLTTLAKDHYKNNSVDPADYMKTYLSAYKNVPITILINKETASGAEIIVAAMQEYGRATIIGQDSAGQNTLQTIFPMHSGEALKITTAIWLTPSGKSIRNIGIKPDIVTDKIESSKIDTEEDETLKSALNFLMKNKKL